MLTGWRIDSLIPVYLLFLNRAHGKRREQLGKSAQLVDESMMAKGPTEGGSKAVEAEEGREPGRGAPRRALEEDNALNDMTDLQNEDFIYVY